jgi:hypothetical protein
MTPPGVPNGPLTKHLVSEQSGRACPGCYMGTLLGVAASDIYAPRGMSPS